MLLGISLLTPGVSVIPGITKPIFHMHESALVNKRVALAEEGN